MRPIRGSSGPKSVSCSFSALINVDDGITCMCTGKGRKRREHTAAFCQLVVGVWYVGERARSVVSRRRARQPPPFPHQTTNQDPKMQDALGRRLLRLRQVLHLRTALPADVAQRHFGYVEPQPCFRQRGLLGCVSLEWVLQRLFRGCVGCSTTTCEMGNRRPRGVTLATQP